MKLYDYQENIIKRMRQSPHKHQCIVLGCGGGKTVIQAEVMKCAAAKKKHCLYLVHRRELISQAAKTLERHGVKDYEITTVQGFKSCSQVPDIIITDECHHSLAKTYTDIYEQFPDAYLLGFTATPVRLNEGGLGKVYDDLIQGPSTKWLIAHKFLSQYEIKGLPLADADNLHIRAGDFKKDEVAKLMEKPKIYGDSVTTWLKFANGKKTIVYCASVKASKATAEQFRAAAGISAMHLDGTTAKTIREQAVQDFRDGKIAVLTNVDLFGEGFDVPDCECVVLLRPTASLTVYIQQSMRSMRYQEGKTALIIDHCENYLRHGFPDDDREWSLDAKKHKTNTVNIHTCKECFGVYSGSRKCPYCGYEVPLGDGRECETVDAELVDVTNDGRIGIAEMLLDVKDCTTWEDLEIIRKVRHYHWMWSIHTAKKMGIKIPGKYRWL